VSAIRAERDSRDPRVARVILARPGKKNAIDREMASDLADTLLALDRDVAVRVVLLGAEGPDFCAGADLEALESLLDAGAVAHRDDSEALGRVLVTLRELTKPVVAAVRGRALAGGAGLATACDIVVAHEGAQFGYPEVRIGFVPAMVMTMLRRSVGEKRAFDLVSTGRLVGAREALELGLVSRVVPDSTFESDATALACEIAALPVAAVRLTKRLFYALDGLDFRTGIERGVDTNVEARSTEEFRDGVRAFAERARRRRSR
jgi:methylglutaconyl-CoA hydratase